MNNKFVLILTAAFVVAFASVSSAQVVIEEITSAEADTLVANNVLVANTSTQKLVGDDISAGLAASSTALDNVNWVFGDFGFLLTYNNTSEYRLTITDPDNVTSTVFEETLDWYNQEVLKFYTKGNTGVGLTFKGTVNGEAFPDIDINNGETAGLSFLLPGSNASNVEDLTINAVLSVYNIGPVALGDGSLRIDTYHTQGIPESSSFVLLLLSFLTIFFSKRRLRRNT